MEIVIGIVFLLIPNFRKIILRKEVPFMKITVDKNLCPQNHKCPSMKVCPVGEILQNGNELPTIDEKKCIICKKCIKFCPKGAFKVEE